MSMADTSDIAQWGARAAAMLSELGAISADPQRLVRLFLSPEHRRAADRVAAWIREAGMSVSEDALGTVRGHWRPEIRRRLLIGSHIDTVIDAGRYDGPLGVVAGILAAAALNRSDAELPFGIDVLAFGDEEGSRFPATLTSSTACAGTFDRSALDAADGNGVTLREALLAYGKDPDAIASAAYDPRAVLGYIEVHIEQGPQLEAQDVPLGVVTGIVGQSRLSVVIEGEAGHAGTVPMPLRRDALAGAAEIMQAIERIARDNAADAMVATVGKLEVEPGASNVIPGRVTFSLDLRSLTDATRRAAIAQIEAAATRIAAARKLQIAFQTDHEIGAVACDSSFQTLLAEAIAMLDCRVVRLPSGAGHDAQVMAKLCPSAMLFVRCRGGVSHNPAEFASEADMGLAVAALTRFIARLAEKGPS